LADLVFSNTSIQRIGSDIISYIIPVEGAVQQDAVNNSLHLNASAGYTVVAGFEYNWSASAAYKTDALQFNLTCTPDVANSINRVGFYIDTIVQYYRPIIDENTGSIIGYTDGRFDTIRIFPYFVGQAFQGYISSHILSLDSSLNIKKISLYYCNTSDTGVTCSNVSLFSSISMTDKIAQTVGFTISLSRVEFRPNAFLLWYNSSDGEPDRFYWITGVDPETSQEVLTGIDINHNRVISITDSDELLE